MEYPVTFKNKQGQKLFGIIHEPERLLQSGLKIGVNLLNPGVKYRVAPNRMNVKLARELCKKGYFVLRFDPAGIGDSEGDLPENVSVADIWEKIQTGLLVADTRVANDFFCERCALDSLMLAGSCGGAITALIAAEGDRRVCGLCLIDVPVNLRAANMTFADKAAEGGEKTDWLFSEYVKRLLRPAAWYRFLTMQTNYRALVTTIRVKIEKALFPGNISSLPKDFKELLRENKLNKQFFKSFELCMKDKKRIHFILAGNDPGTEIFQRYFQEGFLLAGTPGKAYRELTDFFLIENANHVYGHKDWQDALILKVQDWMDAFEKDQIARLG